MNTKAVSYISDITTTIRDDPATRMMMRFEADQEDVNESDESHAWEINVPRHELIASRPAREYEPPDWLSRTAGRNLACNFADLTNELRLVNDSWAGEYTPEYKSYCASTACAVDLTEQFRQWVGHYVRLRADRANLNPRTPTELHLYGKVFGELSQLLEVLINRDSTIHCYYLCIPRDYGIWLAHHLLWALDFQRRLLSSQQMPDRNAAQLNSMLQMTSENGWDRNQLYELIDVFTNAQLMSCSPLADSMSADNIIDKLNYLAEDMRLVRQFLFQIHTDKTIVQIGSLFAAWIWKPGAGMGIVITGRSDREIREFLSRKAAFPLTSLDHDGLLTNPTRPWESMATLPEPKRMTGLRINLKLVSAIHEKLLQHYDHIDKTTYLRTKRSAAEVEDAVSNNSENDVIAACIALADTDTRDAPCKSDRLPCVTLGRLKSLLITRFGCEVRNGKGSEVVVYRPGGRHAILACHRRNPRYNAVVIRRLLKQIGVTPKEFIIAVRQ